MPDNTIRAGAQNPSIGRNIGHGRNDTTIDLQQLQNLRLWTKKFGVSVETIKEAVRVVGNDAEAVQRYLQDAENDEGERPSVFRSAGLRVPLSERLCCGDIGRH